MRTWARTLLAGPNQFFLKFEEAPPKWIVAYAGFYLVTFVEAIGNLAYADTPASPVSIFFRGALSSLLGAFINLVLFGILWMYLSSKILGGRASLKTTVQAVGYAFVYPGIFSLITVPLMLLSAGLGSDAMIGLGLVCVVLPLQLVLGIWALVYSGIALKQLNNFSWVKTLGVLAWFPVLLIVAATVIAVIGVMSS